MYAIVDIETGGGSYNEERIIEIAIYKYDGEEIIDHFSALVNPETPIHDYVTELTGISDNMVKRAPKFHEVAKRVIEITQDCILVAHNAPNDYRIIRNEFKQLGYDYQRDILDTVKLSEQLIPGLPGYGLEKVCFALGIPIKNRHRADGDAFATVKLLEILMQKDIEKQILKQQINTKESLLRKERISNLYRHVPPATGIFYMHDEQGNIIYMSKALNMRKKLRNILLKQSKRSRNIRNKSIKTTYEVLGCYALTTLKFNQEIKALKPKYNYIHPPLKIKPVEFHSDEIIIVDKGRKSGEESVIYIQEGKLVGYTFTTLKKQQFDREILMNLLSPLDDSPENRRLVKRRIRKKKWRKVIMRQFEENSES